MDLIKLDTPASIELEDFDPLNQNAKPIPSLPGRVNGGVGSTMPIAGFNNPLYPYFEPPMMNATGGGTSFGEDDDAELLRKYGLDQLTLEQSSPGGSSSTMGKKKTATGATVAAEATRSTWTTFE